MNLDAEKQLETEITKALEGLPDLAAPSDFAARTMTALCSAAPRRFPIWSQWPLPLRIAFIIVAVAAVTGVFAELRLVQPELMTAISRHLHSTAAAIAGLEKMASALEVGIERLGRIFIVACMVAAAGACAACAGFGTIFVRLLARPENNQL